MALKRKRSLTEDTSLSTSAMSASSTSPSSETHRDRTMSSPNSAFELSPTSLFTVQTEPYHQPLRPSLNCRTRKRWRDNRPDEESVYSNTLFKLFDAQRNPRDPATPPTISSAPPSTSLKAPDARPQASLNAFLNLPGPAMVVPSVDWIDDNPSALHCEECGRGISSGDGMCIDGMELDLSDRCWCHSCGRPVCDTCAVTRDTRLCLSCDLNCS